MSPQEYNQSITISTLTRDERIDPRSLRLMRYSNTRECCDGFPSGLLCNQAKGFPITLERVIWNATEYIYLCGKWSWEGEDAKAIQEDVRTAKSGYAAKRYKDLKYRKRTRPDWNNIRVPYMLWCVWQKCIHSQEFRQLLCSVPEDYVITEVVAHDGFWALKTAEDGTLYGKNVMGKILTICRRCLLINTSPDIDTDLLNHAGIYLLGQRVHF